MTCTNREEVEGSFNLTKPGNNTMHTFFYSNISEFGGNLEGMLDEGRYRTTVQNMHKLGWKAQFFKSADVSMLVHGCVVSQYPQFYVTIKKIKCYHVHMWEAIHVKRVTNFCTNHRFLQYQNQLKHLLWFQ